MLKTFISLLLAALLVSQSAQVAPVFAAQTGSNTDTVEKIKLKVAKVGVGEKARVTVWTKDGVKRKGFISQAGAEDFTVRDRKTGDPTTILYSDVAKLDNNRGHSTARNLGIGIGIGAGAFLAILAILFASLQD